MGKWDGMVTRWDTGMGTCLFFSLLVVGSGLIIIDGLTLLFLLQLRGTVGAACDPLPHCYYARCHFSRQVPTGSEAETARARAQRAQGAASAHTHEEEIFCKTFRWREGVGGGG